VDLAAGLQPCPDICHGADLGPEPSRCDRGRAGQGHLAIGRLDPDVVRAAGLGCGLSGDFPRDGIARDLSAAIDPSARADASWSLDFRFRACPVNPVEERNSRWHYKVLCGGCSDDTESSPRAVCPAPLDRESAKGARQFCETYAAARSSQ